MASFTKRNGRWRARVRRSGLPPITKSFPTKALALQWSQRVEGNPERFLPEQQTEDYQLEVLGDLIRKYGKDITPKKRGRDKEKYRIRVLEKSFLSEVPLKALRAHHITKFREDRINEKSQTQKKCLSDAAVINNYLMQVQK